MLLQMQELIIFLIIHCPVLKNNTHAYIPSSSVRTNSASDLTPSPMRVPANIHTLYSVHFLSFVMRYSNWLASEIVMTEASESGRVLLTIMSL